MLINPANWGPPRRDAQWGLDRELKRVTRLWAADQRVGSAVAADLWPVPDQ